MTLECAAEACNLAIREASALLYQDRAAVGAEPRTAKRGFANVGEATAGELAKLLDAISKTASSVDAQAELDSQGVAAAVPACYEAVRREWMTRNQASRASAH